MRRQIKSLKSNNLVDSALFKEIRGLIMAARNTVARNINAVQVMTSFEIGRRIVEHEQQGSKRAEYGKEILKDLSEKLTAEFGRGFSEDNLSNMRKFYVVYRGQKQISETASGKLLLKVKRRTVSDQSQKSETVSRKLATPGDAQVMCAQFTLSWSHYVFLMNVNNAAERSFYEIEATEQDWSLREFKRQFDSGLYERLALSRDKKGIKKLSQKGQIVAKPHDLIKNPYVLEFLGLDEKSKYSETDLESAIIDKIEHFLLELGKGFLFEARQKRFTFDEEHFFVDLVFYNRLLGCYKRIQAPTGVSGDEWGLEATASSLPAKILRLYVTSLT